MCKLCCVMFASRSFIPHNVEWELENHSPAANIDDYIKSFLDITIICMCPSLTVVKLAPSPLLYCHTSWYLMLRIFDKSHCDRNLLYNLHEQQLGDFFWEATSPCSLLLQHVVFSFSFTLKVEAFLSLAQPIKWLILYSKDINKYYLTL